MEWCLYFKLKSWCTRGLFVKNQLQPNVLKQIHSRFKKRQVYSISTSNEKLWIFDWISIGKSLAFLFSCSIGSPSSPETLSFGSSFLVCSSIWAYGSKRLVNPRVVRTESFSYQIVSRIILGSWIYMMYFWGEGIFPFLPSLIPTYLFQEDYQIYHKNKQYLD